MIIRVLILRRSFIDISVILADFIVLDLIVAGNCEPMLEIESVQDLT